ncbi:Host cell factor homolog hcf-1 [Caenorhabditis elegans]|uniref:Host cell factor homolog hcf-1 n=1 Tax=Caenorhabditis elegans TaxID=6239 RepID=HCF1_CAEEL|nr:Host cell factor homolog hcf-1 [Caenorhabditis elegans]G5EC23.1 RecName: Full=Host cell factor homolog hcf-1; Short=HCF homolog [Caenorhabditis elegans]AAD12580.1 host cell factor 1 [Caenorhabditis elegans]CCD66593.1 Host cell factor homolog hcf-1 [Caenorhabditis elegans]|eukprot:NP_501279.1 human HCF1 related [Caenorhabditis elegans]
MDEDVGLEATNYSRGDESRSEEQEKNVVRWRIVQQSTGPNPKPRHGHRAVVLKELIVIFGGGNEGMIDELHAYNTQKREWTAPQCCGDVPTPAAAFGAISLGNKIYRFGGMTEYGKYTNDLYELQSTRWEWRRLNPRVHSNGHLPCPRIGHSFVVSQKSQKAYVFGGLSNDLNDPKRNVPHYLDDLYVINLSGPQHLIWEKLNATGPGPISRESHTAVIYEKDSISRMVVYGGMNGVRLGDLWYLNLNTLHWTEIKFDDPRTGIPPMPRSLHSSVLIGDKMFVYGGWVPLLEHASTEQQTEKEWKCTSSLGCWNITEDRWVPLHLYCSDEDTIPRGRAGHCAAAVGDRMYIWSGRDGYRKAWSNQVCCRDMWLLDTILPEQPGKVQLGRAGFNSLEISWPIVQGASGYFLQIGFGDAKEQSVSPIKRATTSPRKQPSIVPPSQKETEQSPKKPQGTAPSIISTQGTTYTAPADPKPATDEGGLPQDLFEDTEKNETASPKRSNDAQSADSSTCEQKKTDESGLEEDSEKDQKPSDAGETDEMKEENGDDDLPWFDVGIIDKATINVTHYFNDRQQSLEKQLNDLIDHNAFKCVNDSVFTTEDKIPLINGQSYRFRVSAINGLGKGAWSETASCKTCVPGYPSAPSSIRITKSHEGAQLTWEPPSNTNISGKIIEYSVYLAVKNQSANSADSQLAFMRVYCGPQADCQVLQSNLGTAFVDQTNKPAIIFRIAARNEKGYGPATQVRWLQDQQKIPVRTNYPNNSGFIYQQHGGQQKRARFDHQ